MPIRAPAFDLTASQSASSSVDSLAIDDRLLVERAQAGDRTAFEALVHRYDRQVLRLALNVLQRTEDAQDVYQEAFLKIYRNLHHFRFECSFYTWLYRIVTNLCLDQLRRRKSRREDPATVLDASGDEMDLMANISGTADDFFEHQQQTQAQADPERNLLGREIGQKIDAAMAALSPRERMIFEMKHYQGLKLRAIGEALGTTEETVKNSLFRATRKLRGQLQGLR
jgi:RNA polymerase sigma-70 factor (ECF subfamily)